jgi:hypothetical protein
MSSPTRDRPTAVLIRSEGKAPVSRRRKLAIMLALIIGLPGLALAASFLFGQITGTARVDDVNQAMDIAQVTGTNAPNGINCAGSKRSRVAVDTIELSAIAQAMTVRVGPADAELPGTRQFAGGSCDVTVRIVNNGPKNVTVTHAITEPAGWDVTAAPVTIPAAGSGNSTGFLVLKITATPEAAGTAAAPAPFGGSLQLEAVEAPGAAGQTAA